MRNTQLTREADIREWLNVLFGNLLACIQRNDPDIAKSLATTAEQTAIRE